jgi:hypothetical protein
MYSEKNWRTKRQWERVMRLLEESARKSRCLGGEKE